MYKRQVDIDEDKGIKTQNISDEIPQKKYIKCSTGYERQPYGMPYGNRRKHNEVKCEVTRIGRAAT